MLDKLDLTKTKLDLRSLKKQRKSKKVRTMWTTSWLNVQNCRSIKTWIEKKKGRVRVNSFGASTTCQDLTW